MSHNCISEPKLYLEYNRFEWLNIIENGITLLLFLVLIYFARLTSMIRNLLYKHHENCALLLDITFVLETRSNLDRTNRLQIFSG